MQYTPIGLPMSIAQFWKAKIPKEYVFNSTGIAQGRKVEQRQEIG